MGVGEGVGLRQADSCWGPGAACGLIVNGFISTLAHTPGHLAMDMVHFHLASSHQLKGQCSRNM
jgi:hypothetical protein